ncbi:dihydrofolate reductase family protein [Bacillus inaquosorum]|uniref:dihydrofolate reductase family protein n=1 Tax=Bacillus inaquosorum TaxID=483913 RepID=UPI000A109355|nr:dihydrofolate reductase family protein [Bacillus inaquosorum]QJC89406.1 Bifunctional deaminase-reductase domain protein [Bacillus subtilis]MEC2063215.1 dihydrofolate reductase family protein [Bacillus inaquosorum]MEC2083914.1 dihydrofolate reductase family protein [Bacillus inaquosorum]QYX42147.1 dihydrofolate reductase family protein [Bacillus inaquosorum]WNW23741.1 dihydrofolate reductase family protein [Bacillus inaquosorum]
MTNNLKQRKIILDLAVTLDGFIEGKNGEVDWCIMDPDMRFTDFLNQIDTILYGRKSYDLWGQYIPKNEYSDTEKDIWKLVHSKKKYVFSRTQNEIDNQAIFLNDNILEEVNKLKKKPGKDIWLYGGASLIKTFINLGLVDEFRLSIHPVVLGEGKPLFMDLKQRINLKMVNTRTFSSGVVQIVYHWNG